MDGNAADDTSAIRPFASAVGGVQEKGGGRESGTTRNDYLKILATVMLGMVVKGTDLERADLVRLGYGRRAAYRAFRALRKAGVLKKVTKKNYALRRWIVTSARRLAEEDIGRPVGWPNIHDFLFVTYGMFEWDERRMDAFLSFLKKDWLHRMYASGRNVEAGAAAAAAAAEHDKAKEGAGHEEERTYSVREGRFDAGSYGQDGRKMDRGRQDSLCRRFPDGAKGREESAGVRNKADPPGLYCRRLTRHSTVLRSVLAPVF